MMDDNNTIIDNIILNSGKTGKMIMILNVKLYSDKTCDGSHQIEQKTTVYSQNFSGTEG